MPKNPLARMSLKQGLWPCIVVLCALVALELLEPYAFCQDDNRDYFIPTWTHSARAIARGELAEFNYHQSLGVPHLAAGQTAALHPIALLSIGVSIALTHTPYLAIELFACLHLLAAALGAYALGRRLAPQGCYAALIAVSWALNPAVIFMTKSWVHVAVLAAALPWACLLLHDIVVSEVRSLGRALCLAGVNLDLFLTGYVQWLVLLCIFEALWLCYLVLTHAQARQGARILWELALGSGLFVVCSLPLLLPMLELMGRSAERSGALPYAEFASNVARAKVWLLSAVAPFSLLSERVPTNAFVEWGSPAGFLHIGFVLVVGVFALPWARQPARPRASDCAALLGAALLFTGWAAGLLSPLLYHVPLLNRFRWPFKLVLFALPCWIALGAAGVAGVIGRVCDARARVAVATAVIILQAANLVAAGRDEHARAFFTHLDELPLRPPRGLPADKGRVVNLGFVASHGQQRYTAPGLGFNYATLFERLGFAGYEPLAPRANRVATLGLDHDTSLSGAPAPETLAYLRSWSVRWYLVHPQLAAWFAAAVRGTGFRKVSEGPRLVVFEDAEAAPLVTGHAGACTTPGLRYEGNTLAFETRCERSADLELSVLCQRYFLAAIDAQPARWHCNDAHKVALAVPAGEHRVTLRYEDPVLRLGALLTVACLVLGAAVTWLLRRRRDR